MKPKTVVISLLDKSWPPEHSFVNGMLAGVAAQQPSLKMRLFVSHIDQDDCWPRRYGSAMCIPVLHPRRGSGRLKNFWLALRLIKYQASREEIRGNCVVVFVRNDPIFLLAGSLMRGRIDRLVFQSSFPHEEYSGHAVKRGVAKLLYRLAGRGVDIVTGVSPEGVKRTQRLCPHAEAGGYIPLLADLPPDKSRMLSEIDPSRGPVFVYVGTHAEGRELEIVLRGIVRAIGQGAVGTFRFVGGNSTDQARLMEVSGVRQLIKLGLLSFELPVPRHRVSEVLANCHVGLSFIPPKPIYYESSPTKLAEYMSAGLAVLASKGIPMQEQFLTESSGGVLVEWCSDAIAEAISQICTDLPSIGVYRRNSLKYALNSLQYEDYLPHFHHLIGLT